MSGNSSGSNDDLIKQINNLESRISSLESFLNANSKDIPIVQEQESIFPKDISGKADSLEFHIGQHWFAKVGIVSIVFGIIFILIQQYESLPSYFPSLIGFIMVGMLFILSNYLNKTLSLISQYLFGSGLLIIYFAIMRLQFFTDQSLFADKFILIILLTIYTCIHLYISFKRNSINLTGVGLTLGFITALLSGYTLFIFIAVTALSIYSVYCRVRFNSLGIFIYGMVLSFLTHFIWLLNNPVIGNEIQLLGTDYINIYFLLLYSIIYAFGNLFRKENDREGNEIIVTTFINSLCFYGLFLLITILRFKDVLGLSHLAASVVFLSLAIIFWSKEKSKYSTFFYSIIGYTALSIAIITQFEKPDFFIWLCWQSLLVISTAIWFRSKIIIVANFIIFLIISVAYLIIAGSVNAIGLSLGIVALVSARILNWQSDRLELKTELMRNAYLTVAFLIIPYALYHTVPNSYVGLSWLGVGALYYLLNIILKNKKYRWMALLTFILTILYVLIIGLFQLEPFIRIVSFLALGIVLIITSIIYTRMKLKSIKKESQ